MLSGKFRFYLLRERLHLLAQFSNLRTRVGILPCFMISISFYFISVRHVCIEFSRSGQIN